MLGLAVYNPPIETVYPHYRKYIGQIIEVLDMVDSRYRVQMFDGTTFLTTKDRITFVSEV